MAENETNPAPPADELQFEVAEFDANEPKGHEPAVSCSVCKSTIPDAYFAVMDRVVCARCRDGILAYLTGGSKLARFVRASLFGAGAAFVGFLIYFGIAKITGLEIGLISVLVGFLVGRAVHKGSNGRGGWVYQCLAVFLSYTAIAASYGAFAAPELLSQLQQDRAERQAAGTNKAVAAKTPQTGKKKSPKPDAPKTNQPTAAERDKGQKPDSAPSADAKAVPRPAQDEAASDPLDEDAAGPPDPPLSPVKAIGLLAVLAVIVVVLIYAIPILVGIQSPLSFLIIGFALWEAWKINRRVAIRVTGPHQVFTAGPETASTPTHG